MVFAPARKDLKEPLDSCCEDGVFAVLLVLSLDLREVGNVIRLLPEAHVNVTDVSLASAYGEMCESFQV